MGEPYLDKEFIQWGVFFVLFLVLVFLSSKKGI